MAGTPGPVGGTCNIATGTWPANITTQNQATGLWNSTLARTSKCFKIYLPQSDGTGPTSSFPTTAGNAQIQSCLDLGIKALISYQPQFTPAPTAADLAAFTSSVNALSALGLKADICLIQEPQDTIRNPAPTATQFKNLYYYANGGYKAAANAAGYTLWYNSNGSSGPSGWASFNPADVAGVSYCDGIAVDFYAKTYASGGLRIDGAGGIMGLADSAPTGPKPFGIWEIGVSSSSGGTLPSESDFQNYINYLTGVMGSRTASFGGSAGPGRLAQNKVNGAVAWFNGATSNRIVQAGSGTTPYQAHIVSTYYPQLYDALTVLPGPGPGPQGPVTLSGAVPAAAQPGAFTPGLQGYLLASPPFTTAIPGQGQPGLFTPADPGTVSLPPPGPGYTPAVPGQAVPGLFTPADPGQSVPPPSGLPFIAQQVSHTETFTYGWSTAAFSGNTPGNMLVLAAAWDVNAADSPAPVPAAYVCDSALNYWQHAGTTSAGNSGARASVWVAANAQPVTWVSCSLTSFAASLAYEIFEIGNAPQFFTADVAAATSSPAAGTLSASPGLTGSADIGISVLAAGSTTTALAVPPPGWAPLNRVQAGAGQPNGVTLFPFWRPAVPAGTNQAAAYTVSNAAPLAAVTVMIEASPYPPAQANPSFPALKVEAGFGFLPGDPTQSPPVWTDITSRCAAKDGTPFISSTAGRSYELAQPETGELTISCDNHDGVFTPGSTASPYYPNVVLGTPIRVSAYWQGIWYFVAFGYVERWPQTWPDMPQWGMSALIAADAFSALSAANSYSALNGDMLIDAPYVLIPCFEQYTTQQNSLNTVITPSECQGLLAANISRVNQRAGTYVDGTGAACQTGQSTTLLGSQDTGFGNSSFTAPLTATSSGPGMVYSDPNMPSPLAASGLTVEFWLGITAQAVAANVQPAVFTAFAAPSNYQTAHPSLQVQVQNFTGNNLLAVTFADGTQMSVPFAPSANPQQVALVFSGAGQQGATSTVSVYVNGALSASQALSAAQAGAWSAVMLGCGNYAFHNGTLAGGAFTAFSLAVYPYQLPLQRIASHYTTGVSGQQNVDATTRIAQVLSWAGLGIPRGGQVTFGGITDGVTQGPAYSLAGSNVSAALTQVITNHQAMAFASPDGTLQYMHRWALFNQQPAAVFGDSPAAGEIPYLPGQSFDYDNSFLYNIDQVTQTTGPTTGITVTNVNTASEAAYFNRSVLQIGIQTTSPLDAYDIANWAGAVYSQPALRLRGLTVDAASNPAAFPTVLGTGQGNAAVVNRRPVGGAPISAPVIVQKVAHDIGPSMWRTSYEMSPYGPLNAVLQLDSPVFDLIGSNVLP